MNRATFLKRAGVGLAALTVADVELLNKVLSASPPVIAEPVVYDNLSTHLSIHSRILQEYYLPVVREQLNNHSVLLEEANGQ